MNQKNVSRLSKALQLKREIIGLKYIYFEHEYSELDMQEYGKKTSFCMMVRKAMDGTAFKACGENFGCRCASEALGIDEEMECVESGQRYYSICLYESRAVAKAVQRDIARIKHRIYGVALGPLAEMPDADVVIFMANPYQLMRVVEGYTYKFGTPHNLSLAGNQGVCADLGAKPFESNDLNFSVLCAGTRQMCKWGDDEMGVGMPVQMFDPFVDGVISTLNYIEYPDRKKKILDSLDTPDELGITIDPAVHYGKLGKEYVRPAEYALLKKGDINAENQ